MSLNSSSGGSTSHPMTHRAKQQSMNAGRRNTNALKADLQMLGPEIVKKSEEKIEDLTIRLDSPNLSENNKRGAHDVIINLLENNKPNKGYIQEIISSLDHNIIQQVKKGTYFEIGGVLYQVTEMPILDGGLIEARTIFPENFENISPRHTFTVKEVLRSMIPENEVGHRLLQFISSMTTQGRDDTFITFPEKINGLDVIRKTPEYPYMDKEGRMRATMEDVHQVNVILISEGIKRK